MRPDENERRPRRKGGAQKDAGHVKEIVAQTTDSPPARRQSCPCGCESRPRLVDDPRCIRYRPAPRQLEAADYYDVTDLGLVPHARDNCAACREVGV